MITQKRYGLVELKCYTRSGADSLHIFTSEPDIFELVISVIEEKYPFKKKEMLLPTNTRMRIDFKKPIGGWNDLGYAAGMACDEAILLLLHNGWEPMLPIDDEHKSRYCFKKEILNQ